MQEQMGNISKHMEIPRKSQIGMPQIKSTEAEIKNAFHGLIGRLDMDEGRIFELEDPQKLKSKDNKDS